MTPSEILQMKKLQEIDLLVEEALKELQSADVKIEVRKILNKLARKCAEINEEDFDYYSRKILYYNSRLRDGQVEEMPEQKPALQPLPEEVPAWFIPSWTQSVGGLHMRIEEWKQVIRHFGIKPREWWHNLKKGDKFIFNNGATREVKTFNGIIDKSSIEVYLGNEESEVRFFIDYCSPYTGPAQSFRDKLSPEMQVEFDKVIETLTNTPQP